MFKNEEEVPVLPARIFYQVLVLIQLALYDIPQVIFRLEYPCFKHNAFGEVSGVGGIDLHAVHSTAICLFSDLPATCIEIAMVLKSQFYPSFPANGFAPGSLVSWFRHLIGVGAILRNTGPLTNEVDVFLDIGMTRRIFVQCLGIVQVNFSQPE